MALTAKGNVNTMWYLDSGCSRHMIGERERFSSLSKQSEGTITFRDNGKGEIIGRKIEKMQRDITKRNLTIIKEMAEGYVPRQEEVKAMVEDDNVSVDEEDLTSSTDVLPSIDHLETKVDTLF
ncbi:hypothetical protein F0562_032042 [Nyssa sinensis]|uniref:Retrovirus-related Pol polyprotein from transposon TNT 1-94-like beta-barrel domain-containing protein n=1 Tax=Nyssa sinensis TaxID=561372 RepID=A0A5J5ATS8_9ASTE|nr:hypothetical protein F0562_032042 [Nyssa sinensis]